jgi:hypothetical protein
LNQINRIEESDVFRVIMPEAIEEISVPFSEQMSPDES